MTVLDLNAATGWYTEILSRAVGPTGHVIAHNHPGLARLSPPRISSNVMALHDCRTSSSSSYGTTT
jgi:predicted methyltransferase